MLIYESKVFSMRKRKSKVYDKNNDKGAEPKRECYVLKMVCWQSVGVGDNE